MTANRLLRVLVAPVGEAPHVRALPARADRFRAHLEELVGGRADAHPVGWEADGGELLVWVNGSRTAVWLPKNRRLPSSDRPSEEPREFLRGTLVLAAHHATGEPRDLSDDDIGMYGALWDYPITVADAEAMDQLHPASAARWSAPGYTRVLVAEVGQPPRVCRFPPVPARIERAVRRLVGEPIELCQLENDDFGDTVEAVVCSPATRPGMARNRAVWMAVRGSRLRRRSLRGTFVIWRRNADGEVIDIRDDVIELYAILWNHEPRLAQVKPLLTLVESPR